MASNNMAPPSIQRSTLPPSPPETPAVPATDADIHIPETGPSTSMAATGKRKGRNEDQDQDERSEDSTVSEAQTSVEVDTQPKRCRVSSEDDDSQPVAEMPSQSSTSTILVVQVGDADPQHDGQAEATALTGKRKERGEDSDIPPGNASDRAEAAQVNTVPSSSPTNPATSTVKSTSNKGEEHTSKKARLDVEGSSSQTAQLSDSDGTVAANTAGNAPDTDSSHSPMESKTSGLLTLPLELLAEILILTGSPQHVLATARSCKTLCDTLLSPNAQFIWREARKGPGCTFEIETALLGFGGTPEKKIFSLPDPPKQFFGEPAYAAFVFDSGKCEACHNETSVLYQSFALKLRLCKKKSCVFLSTLKRAIPGYASDFVISSTAIIPTNEASHVKDKDSIQPGPMWPNTTTYYYRPAAMEEAAIFRANNSSRDDYNEKYRRRQERNSEWMKLCVQLFKWSRVRTLMFKQNVGANETASKILASKYGWERGELLDTAFGSYLRYKNKIIEKIDEIDVKVLQDDIETRLLALSDKRDRRNAEMALMNNRKDVEKAYENIRSSKMYPFLPSLSTFRKLPVVAMLQSAETPSSIGTVFDSLIKDKMVKDLLASQLKKWVDSAKSDLGVILGFPKNWKNASKNILHPVERVTARFLCTRCQRLDVKYRSDQSLDFAGVCLHECSVGNPKHARSRTGKKATWESKNFVKDDKAIQVLKKAVDALGFAEDRDGGNYLLKVGFALVCTSCDPPMVLDSRNIIGHNHRHDDMQCSFTTPLDEIVGYMGGFPYEYGLVQKLLVLPTPSPAIKQEIDRKNYGCRHCLREKQVKEAALAAAASTNEEASTIGTAQATAPATISATPSASAKLAAVNDPQIQLSALVYRPHELGVEGPHDKPPSLSNFNGMRSHLKAKHGIEIIRDEDIFCFAHPDLNI